MRRLFLTTAALWAVASPGAASAATVTFCGPEPIGQCGYGAPSATYFPAVQPGLDVIKIIGEQIISYRSLKILSFDFREVQFPLAIINGNPLKFEISAGGRVKTEKPKNDGVFWYSIVSDQPMHEVDLSVDYVPNNAEVFGAIGEVRISGITPISETPTVSAMATPEASTLALCLVGFGLLGLRGWRARNRPSICS